MTALAPATVTTVGNTVTIPAILTRPHRPINHYLIDLKRFNEDGTAPALFLAQQKLKPKDITRIRRIASLKTTTTFWRRS
jgi:hypothetical protein